MVIADSVEGPERDRSGRARITRASIQLDSRRLSYLQAGGSAAGRTILLIHGSGVSARYWGAQLRGLAGHARVLAPDLPGHGESDPGDAADVEQYADVVALALDALAAGPVVAVGHSLGGAIAMSLAARRPHLTSALVLLSSCTRLPDSGGAVERLLTALPGPVRKLVFFSIARRILFAPGASSEAVRLGMREIRACPPDTIARDVRIAKAMDLTNEAAALRLPTLVLCGSLDRVTPPALSEQLAGVIAGSRLTIIPGAGHMLPLEVPDRVNADISSFAHTIAGPIGRGAGEAARPAPSLLQRVLAWVRR